MVNNIALYRKWIGYTQAELAFICSCRRETIVRLENNKYIPSSKLIARLEYVLCNSGSLLYYLDADERAECDRRRAIVYNHHPKALLEPLGPYESPPIPWQIRKD